MDVKDKFEGSGGHSIEWGQATWNSNDFSVRNRYDNSESGRFNKFGSSEIPWTDFNLMINQSLVKGKFSKSELADILTSIATSLQE